MEPPHPPTLEDLYDEDILARIDRQIGGPPRPRPAASGASADEDRDRGGDRDTVNGTGGAVDVDAGSVPREALAPVDGVAAPAPVDGAVSEAAPTTVGGDGVVPRYPVARRLGVGGAMLAGAMFGVADVLEPDRARQHIIDYVPDDVDESQQLVTFHLVTGDPRASRLVLRPWLLDRFRRSRP
jgi:hypothetical protein